MTPETHEALTKARDALRGFTQAPPATGIARDYWDQVGPALALIAAALLPEPKAAGAGYGELIAEAYERADVSVEYPRSLYGKLAGALSTLSRERDEARVSAAYHIGAVEGLRSDTNDLVQFNNEANARADAAEATIAALTLERDGLKQANANLHTNLADRDRVVALCLEYDATIAELRAKLAEAEGLISLLAHHADGFDAGYYEGHYDPERKPYSREYTTSITVSVGDLRDARAFLAATPSQGQPTKAREEYKRPAYWTHDDKFAADHGDNLYYFAPANRAPPPYRTQRQVTAILDIAADGTLAGVELIHDMPPPPALASPAASGGTE